MTDPLQEMMTQHIARLNEIQQQGIDFAKRVAEHHVEVVERKMKPEMQIAAKIVDEGESENDGVIV